MILTAFFVKILYIVVFIYMPRLKPQHIVFFFGLGIAGLSIDQLQYSITISPLSATPPWGVPHHQTSFTLPFFPTHILHTENSRRHWTFPRPVFPPKTAIFTHLIRSFLHFYPFYFPAYQKLNTLLDFSPHDVIM